MLPVFTCCTNIVYWCCYLLCYITNST